MPANVGEMFYFGDMPWHREGVALTGPATVEDALCAGGLDWEVGEAVLRTAENPPSPVCTRKAIVRMDRPAGHEGRVVGIAHQGFQPVQNRDGALLFDSIFGQGRPVYHTGGYLGHGEVVWLLAKINRPMEIAPNDLVEPYALFANSHDGSMAFNIRLTTVRVVCQNTLAMAMHERGLGTAFRRAHQGTLLKHAAAAQDYFAATLKEIEDVQGAFVGLTKKVCDGAQFECFIARLLPEPKKPANAAQNKGLLKAWETRVADIQNARKKISELLQSGKGMELDGSKGTFWGVLNAVLEYIDHHKEFKGSQISHSLLGDGMDMKTKAFRLVQELSKAA